MTPQEIFEQGTVVRTYEDGSPRIMEYQGMYIRINNDLEKEHINEEIQLFLDDCNTLGTPLPEGTKALELDKERFFYKRLITEEYGEIQCLGRQIFKLI